MSVTNRLISVLSILSCLGISHADTLSVPDQYGTIQSAIDAAQEGDEVVIQPGIYNETFNYNGKGITVRSAEGPLNTRIDQNGASGEPVVRATGTPAGARLEGLAIYDAGSTAIYCDSSATLSLERIRIVNVNRPFEFNSSSVDVTDMQVISCDSRARITGSSDVVLSEVDFRFSGGSLEVTGGTVQLESCDFESLNSSSITVTGGHLLAQNCFLNGSGSNQGSAGGCVSVTNAIAEFNSCLFVNGSSYVNGDSQSALGGCLYSANSNVDFQSCAFRRCTTYKGGSNNGASKGGVIFAIGSEISVIDSTFDDYQANTQYGYSIPVRGAAICVEQSSSLSMARCTMNSTDALGGGRFANQVVFVDDSSIEIRDSEITNNSYQNLSIYATNLKNFVCDGLLFDRSFHIDPLHDDFLGDVVFSNIRSISNSSHALELYDLGDHPVSVVDSTFIANGGGYTAIDFPNGDSEPVISLSRSAFVGYGRALYVTDVEPVIDSCSFISCSEAMFITDGSVFPVVLNSVFCGPRESQIEGPWIDKGGNIFDADCTVDCDGDGLPDDYEIQSGLDSDCNGNLIPDSCETLSDCDGDGILDECAIANGAPDCDGNGIPDDCQADCDGDGTLDVCEITAGATDCNADGVPDDCQLALGLLDDFNNDGTPDVCQTLDFTGLETEIVLIEDRILDSAIPSTAVCYRLYATFDPDSVGGAQLLGVYGSKKSPLMIAAAGGFWQDNIGGNTSASVLCDDALAFPDLRYDSWLTIEAFCANDNLLVEAGIDWSEFNAGGSLSIGDGGVFLYPDDAQGIPGLEGRILIGQVTSTDGSLPTGAVNLIGQNADGSDWQAFGISWPEPPLVDCNGNGIHDAYDLSAGTSRDCDGSGVPDECEYDFSNDCNENGIDDLCDVADGTSGDADGDFVPDECECSGDATRDGIVNVDDIIAVILAWGSNDPDADIDGNGIVDATDLVLVLGGYGACL